MGTFTFLPFIREVNLHQSTMLNLVKSQISRPNYFWQPNICWTAKFCEDTLNHGQAITTGRFYVLWLELKSLTLTSQKLMVKFGTDAKYFPENQTCSFGEMTTSIMNQRTNQQTYVITIPPDRWYKYVITYHSHDWNISIMWGQFYLESLTAVVAQRTTVWVNKKSPLKFSDIFSQKVGNF